MMLNTLFHVCFIYCLLAIIASGISQASDLFVNNQSSWQISLSTKPDPTEEYAATELQAAIMKMSGVLLPITRADETQGSNLIILGTPNSNPDIRKRIVELKLDNNDSQTMAVYTLDENLYLAGNSPRAVLYSVYTFLQDVLDVQWLWPGDSGEFIPARSRFRVPELAVNKAPAFQYRGFHLVYRHVSEEYETWMVRNFINIMRSEPEHEDVLPSRRMKGLHIMFSSHNATLPKEVFESHPEYFALVNGERVPWQLCLSNPDAEAAVVKKVKVWLENNPDLEILSLFPSDNTQYCECDKCSKVSVSTNWFNFFKRVCDAVKPEYPDLKFASIAYQGYLDLPDTDLSWVEFIEYCQYDHCYIHPYGTECELNDKSLIAIKNWIRKDIPLGIYGYDFDIFTLHTAENISIPLYSRIPDQIRMLKKLNIRLVIPEAPLENATGIRESSKQNRLGLYLYAQLMWDPDQSLDTLIDQWDRRVFGDLASVMRKIQNEMMSMWDNADMHLTFYSHYAPDIAKMMLDPSRIAVIADLFRVAKAGLPAILDSNERERISNNIAWEEVLFDQWVEAYWATMAPPQYTISLNKSDAEGFDSSNMSGVGGIDNTIVGMNWNNSALNVRVIFQDMPTHVSSEVADGVRLRIKNINDYNSLYRQITIFPDGKYECTIVPVGTQSINGWQSNLVMSVASVPIGQAVDLSIPFTADFPKPEEGESWLFSIKRDVSEKNDCGSYPPDLEVNSDSLANLYFSGEREIDKRLLMLLPNQVTIDESTLLMKELTRDGWNYTYSLDPRTLKEDLSSYDIICFYTPKDSSFAAVDIGLVAKRALASGKVVIFGGYGELPLDIYLNDPTCEVLGSGWDVGSLPAQSVADAWGTAPEDLLSIIRDSAPPVWGYLPTHPEHWTELATLQTPDDATFPCLIARKYDEGLLVVGGGNLGTGGGWALFGNLRPDTVRMLLNNLSHYNSGPHN